MCWKDGKRGGEMKNNNFKTILIIALAIIATVAIFVSVIAVVSLIGQNDKLNLATISPTQQPSVVQPTVQLVPTVLVQPTVSITATVTEDPYIKMAARAVRRYNNVLSNNGINLVSDDGTITARTNLEAALTDLESAASQILHLPSPPESYKAFNKLFQQLPDATYQFTGDYRLVIAADIFDVDIMNKLGEELLIILNIFDGLEKELPNSQTITQFIFENQ